MLKKIIRKNILPTVLFVIIILIFIIVQFSKVNKNSNVGSYVVNSGPLSKNPVITGLVIKSENIIKANSSGYIKYYAKEGNKINAKGIVYSLSDNKIKTKGHKLNSKDYQQIKNIMESFSKNYKGNNFNSTYSFKSFLEGNLININEQDDNNEYDSDNNKDTNQNEIKTDTINLTKDGSPVATDKEGIVLYSMDGLEKINEKNFSEENFEQTKYNKVDLKTKNKIKENAPVYNIITDEKWKLIIPMSQKLANRYGQTKHITVKFLKDNMNGRGDFDIIKKDDESFGVITFYKNLIRYASDRYLDIEIVDTAKNGLKIPNSAIVDKELYRIPEEYVYFDKTTNEPSINILKTKNNGSTFIKIIHPTVEALFDEADKDKKQDDGQGNDKVHKFYYVTSKDLSIGNAIVDNGNKDRFVIEKKYKIPGVYCINQGFYSFRPIDILVQNDEYSLVSNNTPYGLKTYDVVAKNGEKVKDNDFI